MNFSLIEEVVNYLMSGPFDNLIFTFSMTTNALLLDKYIDFLIFHRIRLLISLDGDFEASQYRVGEKGWRKYNRIISNIDLLQEKDRAYFDKYVEFNAVIHQKNSISEVYDLLVFKYHKIPRFSSVSKDGVRTDKKEEFVQIATQMPNDLEKNENKKLDEVIKHLYPNTPGYLRIIKFINIFLDIHYQSYNDLYFSPQFPVTKHMPTGVCRPFSRKLFLTVDGRILPCERVGHEHVLGRIGKDGIVNLNFEHVAQYYNVLFDKIGRLCVHCYRLPFCPECLFHLQKEKCTSFWDEKSFVSGLTSMIEFLEANTMEYDKVLKNRIL